MKKALTFIAALLILLGAVHAQQNASKPILMKPVYFDVSPPLRDMVQTATIKADMTWKNGVVKNNFYREAGHKYDTGNPDANDPTLQLQFGMTPADTTIQNFDGVGANNGVCPPDTDGDVGTNNYFQVVNLEYAVYNKSGVKLIGPFNNSNIFSGMPNNSNDGDAIVLYDEAADRWLFSQFSLPNYPNGPFFENVAISQTSDPTGSWYRYQFQFTDMPDYPKLGVWQDGYYMSVNRFGAGSLNYKGTGACALNRTKMLAGDQTAEMIYFTLPSSNEAYAVLPGDCDGTLPPAGTPEYFTYLNDGPDHIGIYEFVANYTTPTSSTYTLVSTLPVTAFNGGNIYTSIPQKGTSVQVAAISGRFMHRANVKVFTDHWSMALCGTILTTSTVTGIRWYELRKTTGNPWSIYQEGTFAPSDGNCRWMGSIAMDNSGNMALGYSISSSNLYPSIRYTGRMSSDPLGQMTIAESGIMNGGGSQTNTWSGTPSRWGDYSAMAVDPVDPAKFWYTQEYYQTTSQSNWKTRVGSFSFASILNVNTTATPDSICVIGTTSQLNTEATGGSGTYTYSWTSVPPGFTSTLQNPVVTPSVTTKYACAVSDGTQTKSDTATVYVMVPQTNAGNDTTYCVWVPLFPVQGQAANYSSLLWTTSGTGYFNFPAQLNCLYYPSSDDKTGGSVDLTLTAQAMPPCSGSGSDVLHIIFDPCTGVPEPGKDAVTIQLVPNPAREMVALTVNGLKDVKTDIRITDAQGRIVWNKSVRPDKDAFEQNISLAGLAKGIYIVKVQNSQTDKSEKLIVQ